jgi:hypothetical protein
VAAAFFWDGKRWQIDCWNKSEAERSGAALHGVVVHLLLCLSALVARKIGVSRLHQAERIAF